jgi:serine/threonine-protein kinase
MALVKHRIPVDLSTLSEEELLATLALDDAALHTLARDPRATIEPNRSADAVGLKALEALASASSERTLARGLELRDTLGEGGMGVVRLAMQRSLGRAVAVKTLKSPFAGEAAVLRLLREAWVTGSLEHPNVVPVYDLALDDGGAPIIVLRRIEGQTWERLMHAPDEIARLFGATDPLDWNLGILLRVASAVSLAHSRGIVHRDLKPENVMIGAFGEVYLLDWGIAVSLEADPAGRLPTSSSDVAGTPAYMAPEMFGAIDAPVSERSDIYLLGGILHEILTGRPPHDAGSVRGMLVSAALSKFSFPPSAPKLLVDIAERALSRDPDDRFPSVAAMQQRVEWTMRHRGSLALGAEAEERAGELRAAIAADDHERARRLFAECRFGFRAALRASADNDEAARGLRSATEAIVRYELARGAPEAAAAALSELSDAPADLAASVSAAAASATRERASLLSMQRDQDRSLGARTRRFVGVVLAVLWSATPLVAMPLESRFASLPRSTFVRGMYGWTIALMLASGSIAFWARDSLGRTSFNRRIFGSIFVVFTSQLALLVGAVLMGFSAMQTITLLLLVWFIAASVLTVTLDRRLYPAAIAYLLAFVAIAADPSLRWGAIACANAVLALVAAIAWRGERG